MHARGRRKAKTRFRKDFREGYYNESQCNSKEGTTGPNRNSSNSDMYAVLRKQQYSCNDSDYRYKEYRKPGLYRDRIRHDHFLRSPTEIVNDIVRDYRQKETRTVRSLGTAPVTESTFTPSLYSKNVGIARISHSCAISCNDFDVKCQEQRPSTHHSYSQSARRRRPCRNLFPSVHLPTSRIREK